jgi:hypothetical protein
MALLIVFVIGQSVWLGKHLEQPTEDSPNKSTAANDPKI